MKPRRLQLLVMHVSTRCDQTCAHCSIWKANGKNTAEMSVEQRLSLIEEARRLGARSILFTGGEPLLCGHIEVLCRKARQLEMCVQIATNGLGMARAASWLSEAVDEIYVSLEGPEAIHDSVRGRGSFARLSEGVAALRSRGPRPTLIARSVISNLNAAVLDQTAQCARQMGVDGLSFLQVDTTSAAFGGAPSSREGFALMPEHAEAARASVARLHALGWLGGFVAETERKLLSITQRPATERTAVSCNAPEWSSVIEADGELRPCFFQPAIQHDRGASLQEKRHSIAYAASLSSLGAGNSTCRACVCPKNLPSGFAAFKARVRLALIGSAA